jgi:hypothetical protein
VTPQALYGNSVKIFINYKNIKIYKKMKMGGRGGRERML